MKRVEDCIYFIAINWNSEKDNIQVKYTSKIMALLLLQVPEYLEMIKRWSSLQKQNKKTLLSLLLHLFR